jgi:transketolase
MLLYSMLHLTGYGVTLEDLESFRQWGSITPGHPEYGLTPGVEATTGPLGQGVANAVGMAIAERRLAAEFNREGHELIDHRTYVICSDGDLQEGVSAEACSLAGHLRLGKLIALYDDNQIQLDGPTAWAFTEDVLGRFAAYGWHVQRVEDGNDLAAIDAAITAAEGDDRPSIIAVRTVIGYGSPNKAATQKAHGAPLGPDEVRLTKEAYGWDPDKSFFVPDEAREIFGRAVDQGRELVAEWERRLAEYEAAFPAEAAELKRRIAGRLPDGWDDGLPTWAEGDEVATRNVSQDAIQVLAAALPELFGGSADLSESNLTDVKANGHDHFEAGHPGRNLRFGVREHGMGGIANGIAYHGGFLPYVATFLTFSDYMRGAVRLAALSGLHVTYVWTHDSVGLGEDGPTHQPIEHYAALRAIPNLWFVRPGDPNEAAAAWALAVERPAIAGASGGPVALALTRQKVPTLAGTKEHAREGVRRGGYILREASSGEPQLILIGTGSELQLCATAAEALEADGIPTRVVSLPCWERFDAQDQAYRDRVLPPGVKKRVSVEAGVSLGWERWVGDQGAIIGIDHFGASAPAGTIFKEFGFTTDRVADVGRRVVREGLHGRLKTLSLPHGDHPSLEHGDPGVERTGGSDPGHD